MLPHMHRGWQSLFFKPGILRYGGEEFAIILPSTHTTEQVVRRMRRLSLPIPSAGIIYSQHSRIIASDYIKISLSRESRFSGSPVFGVMGHWIHGPSGYPQGQRVRK